MGAMGHLVRNQKNISVVPSLARSSSIQALSLYTHFRGFFCNDKTHTTYLLRVAPSEIPTEHHRTVCLFAPTKISRGLTS